MYKASKRKVVPKENPKVNESIELYEVTSTYVEYLKKFEPNKILSNSDDKNTRKFIGIFIKKGKYFRPLRQYLFLFQL